MTPMGSWEVDRKLTKTTRESLKYGAGLGLSKEECGRPAWKDNNSLTVDSNIIPVYTVNVGVMGGKLGGRYHGRVVVNGRVGVNGRVEGSEWVGRLHRVGGWE
jgi:hypothetical protein